MIVAVGSVDPKRLGRTERLKAYDPADYDVILTYVGRFRHVILLPNIVTETSNFLGQMKGTLKDDSTTRPTC